MMGVKPGVGEGNGIQGPSRNLPKISNLPTSCVLVWISSSNSLQRLWPFLVLLLLQAWEFFLFLLYPPRSNSGLVMLITPSNLLWSFGHVNHQAATHLELITNKDENI
jgi:hypothetical protein